LDENTRGREYLAKELISYEVASDEELRKADKIIEAGLDIVNVVMGLKSKRGSRSPAAKAWEAVKIVHVSAVVDLSFRLP